LSSLNLSDNQIGGHTGEAGMHALANMVRSNSTLQELNISKNQLDAECAEILAPAIGDNGALTSLNLSSNYLTGFDGDDKSGNMPNPPA
jgi:Ran GTPase-activating protein (RanGAP) involved in mRNA processing and transport